MTTPQPLVKSSQCSQNITRQEYIDVSSFSVVSIFFTFDDSRIMIIIIKTSGPVCKHLRERPQAREARCILWPTTNTRQIIIFDTLLRITIIINFILNTFLKITITINNFILNAFLNFKNHYHHQQFYLK